MPQSQTVSMDDIVALAKRGGFIFQSSEVYGGIGGFYDYGPLGTVLKRNVKEAWWRENVVLRDDVAAFDSSIIMHPLTWKASGHVDAFHDRMVDCKVCKHRFRYDHLASLDQCPDCGSKDSFTEPRNFNLMLQTFVGPMEDTASAEYLRPETALNQSTSPLAYTYDINTSTDTGLMTAASFPAANLSSMSYDAESQPLGYSEAITGSSPDTVSMTYTDRGELLTDSRDPYPAPGAYAPTYANGLRIAGDAPQVTLGWDARRGVLNGAVNPENSNEPVYTYAYDIAGRQTSYTKVITSRQQTTCDEVTTRQYDAENRIIAGGQSPFLQTSCLAAGHYVESYDWGPNGHPARIGSAPSQYPSQIVSDTLHWDGDQLLFTTNAQGQVDDIKIGDQADITPKDPTFTGLTFWDHFDGTLAFCHNSSGSAGSDTNGARISSQWTGNVLGCLNNGSQTMQIPSSEIFSGDLDPPLWSNFKGVGQGGILGMARSDGIEDGFNVIQGARTYDPSAGTWTTPDAYAGDVHDPMTQKSYIWNGSNPVSFSDPTGFDIFLGFEPDWVGGFGHAWMVVFDPNKLFGDLYSWGPIVKDVPFGIPGHVQVVYGSLKNISMQFMQGKNNNRMYGFHIRTTPRQDATLRQYWKNLDKNNEHYNFADNNCVEKVAGALHAIGLNNEANMLSMYPAQSAMNLILHGFLPQNLSDISDQAGATSSVMGGDGSNPLSMHMPSTPF